VRRSVQRKYAAKAAHGSRGGAVAISFDATRYGINFSTESEYLVSVCLNATALIVDLFMKKFLNNL
jgi:hypothetical protein